ncbi:MAG: hypothetical protein HOQ05_12215 [Corynebacteriales bacterium]|nr:hypothetical protein [Mycobacteriales bacterium]
MNAPDRDPASLPVDLHEQLVDSLDVEILAERPKIRPMRSSYWKVLVKAHNTAAQEMFVKQYPEGDNDAADDAAIELESHAVVPADYPTPALRAHGASGPWMAFDWVAGTDARTALHGALTHGLDIADVANRVLTVAARACRKAEPEHSHLPNHLRGLRGALGETWQAIRDEEVLHPHIPQHIHERLNEYIDAEERVMALLNEDYLMHDGLLIEEILLADSGPDQDVMTDLQLSIGPPWNNLVLLTDEFIELISDPQIPVSDRPTLMHAWSGALDASLRQIGLEPGDFDDFIIASAGNELIHEYSHMAGLRAYVPHLGYPTTLDNNHAEDILNWISQRQTDRANSTPVIARASQMGSSPTRGEVSHRRAR